MLDVIKLIAEQLASNGKVIRFKHNSVFAALELSNNTPEAIGALAEKLSRQLQNDISTYKNIIIPFSREYAEAVNKKLLETKATSMLSKYVVTEKKFPKLVSELISKGVVLKKRNPGQIPELNLTIPVPEDGIRKYVKFDNEVLNVLLEEVLISYTDTDLEKLWDKFLSSVSSSNINIKELPFNPVAKIEDIVILLAILENYRKERPLGVRINETSYKVQMKSLYDEVCNAIALAENVYTINVSSGRLVIGAKESENTKELLVISENYDKYIENHTVETLLGLLYSGDYNKVNNIKDIEISANKYLDKWESACKLEKVREAGKEAGRFKLCYSMLIENEVKESSEATKELIEVNVEKLGDVVNTIVNELPDAAILDIQKTTRFICGALLFPSSNFLKFSEYMENYAEINSSLNPEECATMASIDLIVDYLAEQLIIE